MGRPFDQRTHKRAAEARRAAGAEVAPRVTTHPRRAARRIAAKHRILFPGLIRTPETYRAIDFR